MAEYNQLEKIRLQKLEGSARRELKLIPRVQNVRI